MGDLPALHPPGFFFVCFFGFGFGFFVPTCLMAASFLGSLSGELAAAEGICVTDVLALELGG